MYRKVTRGKKYLFDADEKAGLIRCLPGHAYSVEDLLAMVTAAEDAKAVREHAARLQLRQAALTRKRVTPGANRGKKRKSRE